jgi:hypothetical protein
MVVTPKRIELLQKLDANLPNIYRMFVNDQLGIGGIIFAAGSLEKFAVTLSKWGEVPPGREKAQELIDITKGFLKVPDGKTIAEWLETFEHDDARKVLADINTWLDHVFEEDFQ